MVHVPRCYDPCLPVSEVAEDDRKIAARRCLPTSEVQGVLLSSPSALDERARKAYIFHLEGRNSVPRDMFDSIVIPRDRGYPHVSPLRLYCNTKHVIGQHRMWQRDTCLRWGSTSSRCWQGNRSKIPSAFGLGDAISGGDDVGIGSGRDLMIAGAIAELLAGGRGGALSAAPAIASGTKGILCPVPSRDARARRNRLTPITRIVF